MMSSAVRGISLSVAAMATSQVGSGSTQTSMETLASPASSKGFNAIHHAAARGDDELIMYLVGEGVDVTAVARSGQTTADMANGPVQRISPFLGTVALLESLGSKNNHRCVGC